MLVLHCGSKTFRPFHCDLDLDPMTFIYKLDPYSLEIYRMYNELPTSKTRKSDKQTDTTEIIYHAASRVVNKKFINTTAYDNFTKFTTLVHSALHPSGVAKSSTSFGWGKGGKVTSAGWQVTLCVIWHVISRSGVVISITNCQWRN